MPKGKVIDRMYAFVATDEDGDEGICARFNRATGEWMPLVGADAARLESLTPIAQELADALGKPIRVLKFSTRTEVQTIQPRTGN